MSQSNGFQGENLSHHIRLQDDSDPVFKNYIRPFSASPYYDFVDAFLLGLKLETFFQGSDACITNLIYTLDDGFYFYNNITDFTWVSPEAPIMNITKALSGNFSSSILTCYDMGNNAYLFGVDKYSQFDNKIGEFLISFLFNLMGNSLKFKSIFDAVTKDVKTQNYVDIAN